MPADTLVAEPAATSSGARARAGGGHHRQVVGPPDRGLAGQYAVLVALAVIVLVPVVFAVVMALSPPFDYIAAGRPLHPVNVDWKDRTWLDGGVVSVVLRTAVVVLALAWVQLKVAGGTIRDLGLLATPRRVVAIVAGTVATAVLAGQVWASSVERSGATLLWWLVAVGGGGADPARRVRRPRPRWRPVVLALSPGWAWWWSPWWPSAPPSGTAPTTPATSAPP